MRLYKLTDQNLQTRNGFQWTPGEWQEAPGTGELCTSGWLHAYTDPFLAILMNPDHANISKPRLWLAEGDGNHADGHGLKCGVQKLRITTELPISEITTDDCIRFAILCALEVYKETGFVAWANGWLDRLDRSEAARAAAEAAAARAWAARVEEAEAAAARAWAARARAEVARAARAWAAAAEAWAARVEEAEAAAEAAAWAAAARAAAAAAWAAEAAARAAEAAAWVAARAAEAAAWAAARPIDFTALAQRACTDAMKTWKEFVDV
jgi:hypothetical protein